MRRSVIQRCINFSWGFLLIASASQSYADIATRSLILSPDQKVAKSWFMVVHDNQLKQIHGKAILNGSLIVITADLPKEYSNNPSTVVVELTDGEILSGPLSNDDTKDFENESEDVKEAQRWNDLLKEKKNYRSYLQGINVSPDARLPTTQEEADNLIRHYDSLIVRVRKAIAQFTALENS